MSFPMPKLFISPNFEAKNSNSVIFYILCETWYKFGLISIKTKVDNERYPAVANKHESIIGSL